MRRIVVALLAVCAAAMLGSGGANAQPPLIPSPVPIAANTASCGTADVQMQAACAAGLVNNLVGAVYPNVPPPNYQIIPPVAAALTQLGLTESGLVACGYLSGIDLGLDTLYCNGTVHLGQQKLAKLQEMPANPEMVISMVTAHEAMHHIQTLHGVNLTQFFATPAVKPYEQQSDCFAGYVMAVWTAQGIYPAGSAEQVMDLLKGDPPSATHGDASERQAAFWHGFTANDPANCGDPAVGLNL